MKKKYKVKGRYFLFDSDDMEFYEFDNKNLYSDYNTSATPIFISPITVSSNVKSSPKTLLLELTEFCNLRCKYCIYGDLYNHERKHDNCNLNYNVACQRIDEFLDICYPENSNLVFYGGEPLTQFDLLLHIVAYAKKRGIRNFNITTNGVLLSHETLSFLNKENFFMTISLDGPAQIHDKNRLFPNGQPSFDVIEQNLSLLAQKYPDLKARTSFNCVVTEENDIGAINDFFNGAFYENHKIRFPSIEGKQLKFSSDANKTSKIASLILENKLKNDRILYSDIISGLWEIDHREVSVLYCLPFRNRVYVRADGDVQFCERVGNRFGRFKNILTAFSESQFFFEECLSFFRQHCIGCWCQSFCTHCYADIIDDAGNLSSQKARSHCVFIREKYDFLIRLYLEIMNIHPEFFDDLDKYYKNLPR